MGRDEGPGAERPGGGFGTWEWDLVSGAVTWSPEMYRIHGLAEGAFGGSPRDYLPLVLPEDVPRVQEIIGRLVAGGEPRPIEYRIRQPDGEIRHLLGTNEIAERDGGRPVRVTGTVRDVTEFRRGAEAPGDPDEAEAALARSQERFRALIENSFDVITVFDTDGTVIYTTPSCRRVLGYEPAELIGRPGHELLHPGDLEEAQKTFRAALETPGSVTELVHRIRHKDGSYRTVEVLGTNLLAHPAVRGMVSNLRDVTERCSLEEALRQAQKMEAVGRLAGGVAHDFNNLLTVILGEVDMALGEGQPSPQLAASLERIRASGRRAATLTRQLLSFSRRDLVSLELLDLNRLVREVSEVLRRVIEENVELVLELDPRAGRLRGDRSQLEQLVINLVLNGRDAMPRGGALRIATANVTVTPEAARRRPEMAAGEYVLLTVSDSGGGIADELRAHVFEPFFGSRAERGAGLGLATCYGIAKQHGGQIEASSVEGVGTTIGVHLPRGPAAAPAGADRRAGGGGGERILLVEDENAVREVTARMLEGAGYRVHATADSDEAMRVVGERGAELDLLVTDVVLTGMGGRELAERITARYPGMRVLFVSGYADDAMLRRGMAEDGVALVRKPFSAEQLVARVRAVLECGRPVAGSGAG